MKQNYEKIDKNKNKNKNGEKNKFDEIEKLNGDSITTETKHCERKNESETNQFVI